LKHDETHTYTLKISVASFDIPKIEEFHFLSVGRILHNTVQLVVVSAVLPKTEKLKIVIVALTVPRLSLAITMDKQGCQANVVWLKT